MVNTGVRRQYLNSFSDTEFAQIPNITWRQAHVLAGAAASVHTYIRHKQSTLRRSIPCWLGSSMAAVFHINKHSVTHDLAEGGQKGTWSLARRRKVGGFHKWVDDVCQVMSPYLSSVSMVMSSSLKRNLVFNRYCMHLASLMQPFRALSLPLDYTGKPSGTLKEAYHWMHSTICDIHTN